jgi:hypothetical protein
VDAKLTYNDMVRILRDVVLGVPASNDSPAAKAWRAQCEKDVAACRAAGHMAEIPFDPDGEPV